MIRKQDLLDAIAECQGDRNPNANTCIKLAAYYTILNNIEPPKESYSFAPAEQVRYDSGSEFCDAIRGLDVNVVLPVMDELMESIRVLIPKLYNVTIDKLKDL